MQTIMGDETVRFRKCRDGSMTILTQDGKTVIDHISKEQLQRPGWSAKMDDPVKEMRGIFVGMLLGGLLWVPLLWLLFHG